MGKRILSVVIGVIAAMAIVSLVEGVTNMLYPLGGGDLDSADRATNAAIMASIPLPAKILVVLAWLIGALGGAWLALRISDWRWAGWIVTIAVIAGGIATILMLPHPLWMQAGAVVAPLVGGWIAGRLHHKPYPGEPLLG